MLVYVYFGLLEILPPPLGLAGSGGDPLYEWGQFVSESHFFWLLVTILKMTLRLLG